MIELTVSNVIAINNIKPELLNMNLSRKVFYPNLSCCQFLQFEFSIKYFSDKTNFIQIKKQFYSKIQISEEQLNNKTSQNQDAIPKRQKISEIYMSLTVQEIIAKVAIEKQFKGFVMTQKYQKKVMDTIKVKQKHQLFQQRQVQVRNQSQNRNQTSHLNSSHDNHLKSQTHQAQYLRINLPQKTSFFIRHSEQTEQLKLKYQQLSGYYEKENRIYKQQIRKSQSYLKYSKEFEDLIKKNRKIQRQLDYIRSQYSIAESRAKETGRQEFQQKFSQARKWKESLRTYGIQSERSLSKSKSPRKALDNTLQICCQCKSTKIKNTQNGHISNKHSELIKDRKKVHCKKQQFPNEQINMFKIKQCQEQRDSNISSSKDAYILQNQLLKGQNQAYDGDLSSQLSLYQFSIGQKQKSISKLNLMLSQQNQLLNYYKKIHQPEDQLLEIPQRKKKQQNIAVYNKNIKKSIDTAISGTIVKIKHRKNTQSTVKKH